MRLPTFYEQNLIPNWGRVIAKFVYRLKIQEKQYMNQNQ